MKPIKFVEKGVKTKPYRLGDILKIDGVFGIEHHMIVKDGVHYRLLDLSDMMMFGETGETIQELVEEVFKEEGLGISLLEIEEISTNQK